MTTSSLRPIRVGPFLLCLCAGACSSAGTDSNSSSPSGGVADAASSDTGTTSGGDAAPRPTTDAAATDDRATPADAAPGTDAGSDATGPDDAGLQPYVNLSIDGVPRNVEGVGESLTTQVFNMPVNDLTYRFSLGATEAVSFYLSLDDGAGTFDCSLPRFVTYGNVTGTTAVNYWTSSQDGSSCNVTRLDPPGGLVEGTAHATLWLNGQAGGPSMQVDLDFRAVR
jgi:hypothetical protein